MAGKVKKMIDEIIEKVSKGSPIIKTTTRTKIILKGINVDKYDAQSADDPVVIQKISEIAKDFGLSI